MKKYNDESSKFDMQRINQLINSPINSPPMVATHQLKKTIDLNDQIQMQTPVFTGKTESVNSINLIIPIFQRFPSKSRE
jgi:hypothetical protein